MATQGFQLSLENIQKNNELLQPQFGLFDSSMVSQAVFAINSGYYSDQPSRQPLMQQEIPLSSDSLQHSNSEQMQQKVNFMVEHKIKKKKIKNNNLNKQSLYIKNCSRYIIRQIIIQIKNFKHLFQPQAKQIGISFKRFENYFEQRREEIQSLDAIRKCWIIIKNDFSYENKMNQLFKKFCKFFLKAKARRYILFGQMKRKTYYMRTVRHMLKYIDNAENYRSNIF